MSVAGKLRLCRFEILITPSFNGNLICYICFTRCNKSSNWCHPITTGFRNISLVFYRH